jgi:hypothetical protein
VLTGKLGRDVCGGQGRTVFHDSARSVYGFIRDWTAWDVTE